MVRFSPFVIQYAFINNGTCLLIHAELRSKEKAVSSPMRFIAPSDLPSDFAANSGMQWDEERKEWRGNQVDLLGFSSNATMHKSIQRITDFTALYGAHQPIYHPSGMRFDPEKLVWVSPPGDSTADIFALDSPRSNSSLDSSASDDPSSQAMGTRQQFHKNYFTYY